MNDVDRVYALTALALAGIVLLFIFAESLK